jgi:hypothetical protein
MPGCFRQVPGGVAGYESFFPQVIPPLCLEGTIMWDRRWQYQRRSPDNVPQWDFTFLSTGTWWPMMSSGAFSDPAIPSGFFMEELLGDLARNFEPWQYGMGGSQSRKFIMGQCKQPSGDPFGGARVYGYRTSDTLPIGYVDADDKGRYELGCPNTPSDAHFLVARASGSPEYVGVTVNTIVPTWRDGT